MKFIAQKNSRGFTLIELIISLVIIAIIATVSFSNLSGHQEKMAVDLEAEKIVAYLRETRNRALAGQDNSSWGVHFVNVADGTDYYNLFKGSTFDSSGIVDTHYLSKKVELIVPPVNSSTDVIFAKSTGNLSNSATATIVVRSVIEPRFSSTIEINRVGQINY
ncbi:MAG TPA: prepilin-type N-terminal cleavage/methylation domain-containing protein [Candidatus Paceibacterota bacterium]|nr:prepilin-type N-terminal cleavage/methylation domain-containing protein [Candidatus Paceibacterota bacterium]HOL53906.1 prepilin-type N-terminal cleavage/methylation domain-containing protein [Candidatus Paceibacterota bacterium]HON21602.1 prepilin-type N-terminal cleavage/methylation domain-containing protein [Candidatus Paceibacterota bacterium]HOV88523.1 prepilin-type N-terminal cleavage/methylation domain-containing protein [Candidatus Paceibacterota bacterium]HPP16796.1 prepilin-type N-